MKQTRNLLIAAVLTCLHSHGVAGSELDSEMTASRGPSLTSIVPCVLEQEEKRQQLQKLDADVSLYTHPCSGGIYIVDTNIDPAGEIGNAIPLVQGWWLEDYIGAHWSGHGRIEVRARFITGVGPSGVWPFTAWIQAQRLGRDWLVEEPLLEEELRQESRPARQGLQ